MIQVTVILNRNGETVSLFDGIVARKISTPRLTVNVLQRAIDGARGDAIVLRGFGGTAPDGSRLTMTMMVAAEGGRYRELVLKNCGHSPHLEYPAEFLAALGELIASTAQ